ncbi:PD-(D/E)XK nuclease family protein [Spiroplasma endosymbiont of Nebria brevicollis]|uniref:PD-(D/E)XK nuclease family protein n=1 Tax=Spiroplasma endosymbiont of Nebria brevicollis TaxID=3066284 RepID=UPI00313CB45F
MQLNEQKNNLIFKKDTHQYFLNKEEKISVSKIIQYYLYEDKNPYENIPFDRLENARLRGETVHKVAELYFKNININNIKDKLLNNIQHLFNKNYLQYCENLLNNLQEFKVNTKYICEQVFTYDIIAGTPDLIYKENNLYTIIDFKTLSNMYKENKEKSILQLTAYYWILKNNGFNLSNTHYIYWIQKDNVEKILVEITDELVYEWEMAIALWKENH